MTDAFRFAAYDEELHRDVVRFHQDRDHGLVIPILRRIMQHYLPKHSSLTVEKVLQSSLATVGLDSLTLMEITLDLQDAFGISFTDDDLKNLTSFSEITSLIDEKIKALSRGRDMKDAPRVAVTGLGFVCSIGNGQDRVLESLRSGRTGIDIHPELEAACAPVRLAGLIQGFDFPSEYPQSWRWPDGVEIPRQQLRSLPPHGVYAHVALKEALGQAQFSDEMLRDEKTGLLTASVGSTRLSYQHLHKMLERGVAHSNPFVLTCSIAGTLSFNLGASLGIRGVSGGCVSACASSAQALGLAFDQIRLGRQQRMIVVGAEDCDLPTILPFASFHALTISRDPAESPCAFDRRRDGFAATGGAAVLVLEEMKSALDRGVQPLAEMVSWGWTSDGFHPMSPEPEGRGLERAMRMALAGAQIAPAEIGYVNAHASSTPAGDKAEALALTRLFGANRPWISSTKSQTGHALSMAGALEAGLTVLALKHGVVPANVNLRDPDPAAESLRLPSKPERCELTCALSNSSGFGGVNVALFFRKIS